MKGIDPWKKAEDAALALLTEGTVSIPGLLLRQYAKLRISELEVMLLIHLLAFREKEQKEFPTLEELQSRMSAPPEQVIKGLQKLMKNGLLAIDEEVDPQTGVQYERYNLEPLLARLAVEWIAGRRQQEEESQAEAGREGEGGAGEGKDLFTIFEKEFARPLSPMECETIATWLDQDKYSQELVLAALKEAVFAGKVHLRYIDRILLEWQRNRVHTVEQAKEHAIRFRSSR